MAIALILSLSSSSSMSPTFEKADTMALTHPDVLSGATFSHPEQLEPSADQNNVDVYTNSSRKNPKQKEKTTI